MPFITRSDKWQTTTMLSAGQNQVVPCTMYVGLQYRSNVCWMPFQKPPITYVDLGRNQIQICQVEADSLTTEWRMLWLLMPTAYSNSNSIAVAALHRWITIRFISCWWSWWLTSTSSDAGTTVLSVKSLVEELVAALPRPSEAVHSHHTMQHHEQCASNSTTDTL